jgi:hypothetical protein
VGERAVQKQEIGHPNATKRSVMLHPRGKPRSDLGFVEGSRSCRLWVGKTQPLVDNTCLGGSGLMLPS